MRRAIAVVGMILPLLSVCYAATAGTTESESEFQQLSDNSPEPHSATAHVRVSDGEVVKRVFAAWNSHDPEKVLGFYTDDVMYEDVPLGTVFRGKAEFRKLVEETFGAFPDLKVQLVSSYVWRNHGVSQVMWSGTDKGYWKTNKPFFCAHDEQV